MAPARTGPQRRRRSQRLQDYDYGTPGWYFVTICAHRRACLFGFVDDGRMHLGVVGELARTAWLEIPLRHPGVELDAFVVMPNHVHAIVALPDANGDVAWTLGDIIRGFKARVSYEAKLRQATQQRIWQRNYYEHVIRADESLDEIRRYIDENPARWECDDENPIGPTPRS